MPSERHNKRRSTRRIRFLALSLAVCSLAVAAVFFVAHLCVDGNRYLRFAAIYAIIACFLFLVHQFLLMLRRRHSS